MLARYEPPGASRACAGDFYVQQFGRRVMVVALLILIVFILLFGAAAVTGFIADAFVLGLFLIFGTALLVWISLLTGLSITNMFALLGVALLATKGLFYLFCGSDAAQDKYRAKRSRKDVERYAKAIEERSRADAAERARIRAEHEAIFGAQVTLTKQEKKALRARYRIRAERLD